ncbi:MAG TPA: preprotein translocase subunit SecE [Acidimicrobiales bacterium]|nr:preprotein translocase subunit SecE [Acidimicrobiales bacterium]
MLQRQGALGADGSQPVGDRRQQVATRRTAVKRERTSPVTFLKEVRGELRRVAWPTKAEVVNYSTIVLFTLILLVALIFVLDYAFAKSVLFLFESPE